jgi:hypothetical protein
MRSPLEWMKEFIKREDMNIEQIFRVLKYLLFQVVDDEIYRSNGSNRTQS